MATQQQVKEFAELYPCMSVDEISAYFNVSRQRIYAIFNIVFTKEELIARKKFKKNVRVSEIKSRLLSKETRTKIVNELNISNRTYSKIINSDLISLNSKIKDDRETEYKNRISEISFDFKSGMSFHDLLLKYDLGKTDNKCSSFIGSFRKRYGENMFPYRQIKTKGFENV